MVAEKPLKEIFYVSRYNLKIYMDEMGQLSWSNSDSVPLALEDMPSKLQAIFLMKCIQDHVLAERTKNIRDSIAWIDLYIKGKYLNNESLDILD